MKEFAVNINLSQKGKANNFSPFYKTAMTYENQLETLLSHHHPLRDVPPKWLPVWCSPEQSIGILPYRHECSQGMKAMIPHLEVKQLMRGHKEMGRFPEKITRRHDHTHMEMYNASDLQSTRIAVHSQMLPVKQRSLLCIK